ncbi:MAG: hypothetical protein AB7K24_07270 [Gemmataceae bacterium]
MKQVLFIGVGGLLGSLVYLLFVPIISTDEFQQLVDKELPRGTPRARVESWLHSRELAYANVHDVGTKKFVGLAGRLSNYRLAFSRTEIRFYFRFDENEELISVHIHQFTVSL